MAPAAERIPGENPPRRYRSSLTAWVLLACGASLVVCGCGGGGGAGNDNANDNGNDNVNPPECPETHRPQGPACVPVFDRYADCAGDHEVPVLGGGCLAVGVTECEGGLVLDGGCQPVGVDVCAAGFVADGEGGCDALLPPGSDPCPPDTMEVLGETTCQPIGDCGDTGPGAWPWGNLTDDGTTVYVDATADATGADGTSSAPYPTVSEALAAVSPGGQVAVAAGDYAEHLVIDQPVRLAGRCAARVILRGGMDAGLPYAAVSIGAGGTGTSVRGVTLTGPGRGVEVTAAQQVSVSEVQILDTGDHGIWAANDAEVQVARVVVSGATTRGVLGLCSVMTIHQSVVRSTRPQPGSDYYGRGIQGHCEVGMGTPGSLVVTSTLVDDNRGTGIFAGALDVTIAASVVRNTRSRASDQAGGRGISIWCQPELERCGTLAVSDSLIAGNREIGLHIAGAATTVTRTVVRDTQRQEDQETFGRGINAVCDPDHQGCSSLVVDRSLVHGNREVGILSFGSETTVTRTVVRDTLSRGADSREGVGIVAGCSTVTDVCGSFQLVESLIVGNRTMGVAVGGVDATVIGSMVRDTLPRDSDQAGGFGISALCHPDTGDCGSLAVVDSAVVGNRYAGLFLSGVDATVSSSVVRDTLPQQSDLSGGRGISVQCNAALGICGSLAVTDSLVARSQEAGILSIGVATSLLGSAVVEILAASGGQWSGDFGQGIWAQCDPTSGSCGNLELTASLVEDGYTAGVGVLGVSGFLHDSVIRDVAPRPLDDTYGYGLQVQGLDEPGAPETLLHVTRSQIADASVAGILYFWATGTLTRSVVSGADFAVAYSTAPAPPTDSGDNVLQGGFVDGISRQDLEPSEAPPPVVIP